VRMAVRWLPLLYLWPCTLHAMTLEVQNKLEQDVNLHVSGEGSKVFHQLISPSKTKKTFPLNANHFENRPYFKIICSTGMLSNPDLGVCSHLSTSKNHVILIQETEMGHIMECITLE